MDKANELRIEIRKAEEKISKILNEFSKNNGSFELDIDLSQTIVETKNDPENKYYITDVHLKVRI
tara:strand:+ start:53 stop:247 length:195 start_codon:yes stop_codon:yes gene_type:complete